MLFPNYFQQVQFNVVICRFPDIKIIVPKLQQMALLKDIIVLAAYFLLVSIVLSTESAWVDYLKSQSPPAVLPISGGLAIFITIIVLIPYFLLLAVIPFLNYPVKTLALAAAGFLFLKYISQILNSSTIFINKLMPSYVVMEHIGKNLFILTSLRLIQVACLKNGSLEKIGRCLSVFTFTQGLSVTIGFVLAEPMYRSLMSHQMLIIILSCFATLVFIIAYFSFRQKQLPSSNVPRVEQPQPQIHTPPPSSPLLNERNQQLSEAVIEQVASSETNVQIYRGGMKLRDIVKKTLGLYAKMILMIPVQLYFGILLQLTSRPELLEYLVQKTQNESEQNEPDIVAKRMMVFITYGIGAAFSSVLVGLLTDVFSIRRVGCGVLVLSSISFTLLYYVIFFKYSYTPEVFYMVLGMTTFSLYTWLLCACSKIYGGKFQIFGVNLQIITIMFNIVGTATYLLPAEDVNSTLLIELALLVICSLASIFFVSTMPSGSIDVEFNELVETSQVQVASSVSVPNEISLDEREMETEMASKANQNQISVQTESKQSST